MNLDKVYEAGFNCGYPDEKVKANFGRRGKKFLADACRLAGVSPMPKYPSFNPGGMAGMGDVYCYIAHPDETKNRRLEIFIGEMGAFYRTNDLRGGSKFGPNIWIDGPYNHNHTILKMFTEEYMVEVIRKFLDGRLP